MDVLDVKDLCKTYPAFQLKNVSFSLEKGKITGFIGRNGAGKSTTLKSLLGFVHPNSGSVSFFGQGPDADDRLIKPRIGFVSSGVNYYPKSRLKTITSVTSSFFANWDDSAYARYLKMFALDEQKTPSQLSEGMKVKYALALALSHNAELLILDEPTSGLDPVSRDDLLEVFMALCDEGKTILFSTHITSDLDKCADNIIYIQNGAILAESSISDFVSGYRSVDYADGELSPAQQAAVIGPRRSKKGVSAIVSAGDAGLFERSEDADLEAIMVHLEKEEAQ